MNNGVAMEAQLLLVYNQKSLCSFARAFFATGYLGTPKR